MATHNGVHLKPDQTTTRAKTKTGTSLAAKTNSKAGFPKVPIHPMLDPAEVKEFTAQIKMMQTAGTVSHRQWKYKHD